MRKRRQWRRPGTGQSNFAHFTPTKRDKTNKLKARKKHLMEKRGRRAARRGKR